MLLTVWVLFFVFLLSIYQWLTPLVRPWDWDRDKGPAGYANQPQIKQTYIYIWEQIWLFC